MLKKITKNEINIFSEILVEVTTRMENKNKPMWPLHMLNEEGLKKSGYNIDQMYLYYIDEKPVATVILQEKDDLFWGENSGNSNSLYLHKIAIRNNYTGKGLLKEIIKEVETIGKNLNKTSLRLDCRNNVPKLREVYENVGFTFCKVKYIEFLGFEASLLEKTLT